VLQFNPHLTAAISNPKWRRGRSQNNTLPFIQRPDERILVSLS